MSRKESYRRYIGCVADHRLVRFRRRQPAFYIFQYFISVVSTQYIDAGRRRLDTNQYSVTDMSRKTQHGQGVPGEHRQLVGAEDDRKNDRKRMSSFFAGFCYQ